MLKSLKIENFRRFQTFELQRLGRVNLLVGNNNSGKTSILEGIQLLYSENDLEPLAHALDRRGEYFSGDGKNRIDPRSEFDISHLFYGHQVQIGKNFSILGVNDSKPLKVSVAVDESKSQSETISRQFETIYSDSVTFEQLNRSSREFRLSIKWRLGDIGEIGIELPLKNNNGIHRNVLRPFHSSFHEESHAKNLFITSSSLTVESMTELFDQVVLTPEEELIYNALQKIEPNIERIATVGFRNYRNAGRGGFVVRFSDDNQRIPIGSMEDGIWRMLGITLAIANTKDGVLLIDEIDTGLHFSVMSDMWKLILEASKRINVQVFAKTHNSDCWTSLAAVANSESHTDDDSITIHRIEREKSTSVMFNKRQMAIAAERGIEVR